MDPTSDDPKTAKPARAPEKMTRDARLKAALKANMARRKAQAKAAARDEGLGEIGGVGAGFEGAAGQRFGLFPIHAQDF